MGNTNSSITSFTPCFNASSGNCTPVFGPDDATVVSLGGIVQGQFQADPDIAGIGIIMAFMVPTGLLLLICFIVIVSTIVARIHDYVQQALYDHDSDDDRKLPSRSLQWVGSLPFPKPGPPKSPVSRPDRHARSHRNIFRTGGGHAHSPGHFASPAPPPAPIIPMQQHQFYPPPNQHQWQPEWQPHHNYPPPPPEPSPPPPTPSVDGDGGGDAGGYRPDVGGGDDAASAIGGEDRAEKRQRRLQLTYDMFEAVLFSVPDSQLPLALALVANFATTGRCQLSEYHFDIAINLMLLASSDFLLLFAVARNFWIAPIAASIRLIAHIAVMAALAYVFNLMWQWGSMLGPENVPPPQRNDSLIFIPAACFLDPQFSTGIFGNLTEQQQQTVGGVDNAVTGSREFQFFLILALNTVFTMIVQLGQGLKYLFTNRATCKEEPSEGSPVTSPFGWANFFDVYILACSLAAAVSGIYTIAAARDWVSGSGWIANPDAENDANSFGQQAALMTLAAVLIALFAKYKPGAAKSE